MMPPVSRRHKKHREAISQWQSRNFWAAVLLLLAVGACIWIGYMLMPKPDSKVYVSLGRVNYGQDVTPNTLPFALETCQKLRKALLEGLADSDEQFADIHEIESGKSFLEVFESKASKNDSLIVYLNGHVVSDGKEVFLVPPERDVQPEPLWNWFEPIAGQGAGLKVIFLDAGQQSWSPLFPGRSQNSFQEVLAEKIKDKWAVDDNIWVIVSHSENEISLASTPLQSTLFGLAISESLSALREEKRELNVPDLFAAINARIQAYSRNFDSQALQHPALFKSGVGRIPFETNESSAKVVEEHQKNGPLLVLNKSSEKQNSNADAQQYSFSDFRSSERTQFVSWYQDNASRIQNSQSNEPIMGPLPYETFRHIENFLNFGVGGSLTDSDAIAQFVRDVPEIPNKAYFDVDEDQLSKKQLDVRDIRKSLIDLGVRIRFLSHMRLWSEETNRFARQISMPDGLRDRLNYSDNHLRTNSEFGVISRWLRLANGLKGAFQNQQLFERIESRVQEKDLSLTPVQAELLGVASERFLPLLRNPEAGSDAPPATNKKFAIDLEVEAANSSVNMWQNGFEQQYRLAQQFEIDSDFDNRLLIAFGGTEKGERRRGVAPAIQWSKQPASIAVQSPAPPYQWNVFRGPSSKRIGLRLESLHRVDVELLQPEDWPDNIRVWLSEQAGQRETRSSLELGPPIPSGVVSNIDLYVNFDADTFTAQQLSQPLSFAIRVTNTDPNANIEVQEFPFEIALSNRDVLRVTASRKLGKEKEEVARLFRWRQGEDGNPELPTQADDWQLILHTFPNIKSSFRFALQNNLSSSDGNSDEKQRFVAVLYGVENAGKFLRETKIRPDRLTQSSAATFVNWLRSEAEKPGSTVMTDGKFLRPVAKATVSTGEIKFSPILPNEENADAEPTPAPTSIENGLLLMLWDENEVKPQWYQFIKFQLDEPLNFDKIKPTGANPEFRFQEALLESFDNLQVVEASLLPKFENEPVASLTVVSQGSIGYESIPKFDAIRTSGMTLSRTDNKDDFAYNVIDVLGIPNFATFETDRDTTNTTIFRTDSVGIRLDPVPDTWSVYPSRRKRPWSFVMPPQSMDGQRRIVGSSDEVQEIFVKNIAEDGIDLSQIVTVEFSLPLASRSALTNSTQEDFQYRWDGNDNPIPLLYPNHRQHHASVMENGLEAWSEVRAHISLPVGKTISQLGNSTLEVFRSGNEQTPIGKWKFVTQPPPGASVGKVSLSDDSPISFRSIEERDSKLANQFVELDLSRVRPPVDLANMQLNIGETKFPKFDRFLSATKNGESRFRFSLARLMEGLGEEFPKGRNRIAISGIGFFGQDLDIPPLMFEMVDNIPKPPQDGADPNVAAGDPGNPGGQGKPPKKPEPVVITLRFQAPEGKKLQDIREFKSISINGVMIPFGEETAVGNSMLYAQRKEQSIALHGVMPETYSIEVQAVIKFELENSEMFSGKCEIVVTQEPRTGQVGSLTIE